MYSELVVHRLDNWSDRAVARVGNPYRNREHLEEVLGMLNKKSAGRCYYTYRHVTHTSPNASPELREARGMDFADCMDVLDWFDDMELFEYLYHTWVSKSDGDERIERAMPMLRNRAQMLIDIHADTEEAYPA